MRLSGALLEGDVFLGDTFFWGVLDIRRLLLEILYGMYVPTGDIFWRFFFMCWKLNSEVD